MTHRAALLAAASIGVVIFAAAVAVGANLGILNAADSQPVGKLSAVSTAEASVPPPAVGPTVAAEATAPPPQKYLIKKAGKLSVTATKVGLRLQDVTAKHGWRWALAQTSDSRLTVTFQHRSQTYTFVAVLARHGMIAARVDHPVTRAAPSAPSASQVIVAATPTTVRASAPPAASTHSGQSGNAESGHDGGNADD